MMSHPDHSDSTSLLNAASKAIEALDAKIAVYKILNGSCKDSTMKMDQGDLVDQFSKDMVEIKDILQAAFEKIEEKDG
jgi:hypothetical protein